MKKISFFIQAVLLTFLLINDIVAQQFIAKCDLATNYSRAGICSSSRSFKAPKIVSPITYDDAINISWSPANELWTKTGDYRTSETVYVIVNNWNNLSLVFDPTDYEIAYGRALNFSLNGAKSYGTLSHSDNRWVIACNYNGSISFTVNTYDVPSINSVSYPNCNSELCDGSAICMNNASDNIVFNLTAINPGSSSLYVYAYDNNNNIIGSASLGTYSSTKSVVFSTLGLNNHYGKDIRFRMRASLGGQNIYSTYSPTYQFYKQVPTPGTITTKRYACYPYVTISIPLAQSIVDNIDEYKVRAIYGNCETGTCNESTSNIIRFIRYGTPSGNVVTYRVDTIDRQLLDNVGYYTTQIFQSIQETGDKQISFPDLHCAVKKRFYLGALVQPIALTANPRPKAVFDGTTYHTSKYNLNDAQIYLDINEMSRVARVDLDYECNFNSSCHSYCTSCRDMVNITSLLQTVDYNTRSLSMNFGDSIFSFRVTDTDGCFSNISPVTLTRPADITLNQPTASVVTCHVNNTGTGSKSDGIIRADFNGGIGNYIARLYNNTGTLLETKMVTASNKSGSYYFAQFSPRGVGRYRVRVTDRYSVFKEQYIDVTSNPEVILSATPTDLTCFENSSGSIQLSVTNKRTTYATFELTGETSKYISGATINFLGLDAGTYTATVTNTDGCQDIVNNIPVGQPNDIIINATGSKIARYGDNTGTINLEISEGTGDFDYTVYNHSGNVKAGEGSTSHNATITGLFNGYYRVEVTDDNGCPQTHSNIRVRQPDAPLELSFSHQQQNVDCFGNATGEVYPTATGGWGHYQYGFNGTVNGTSNTIGGLTATGAIADTVFVVDSAGVIERLPITITEPTQLITSVNNIYNLKCFEDNSGAVKLNISGGTPGYRVSMDNANWTEGDSLSNLSVMTDASVYMLDANDCPSLESITITQPDKIAIAVDTLIDAFCGQDNGGITTSISGGTEAYSYNWTYLDSLEFVPVNSNIIGGIYSGQYKLLLTDAHGCKDSLTVSVSDTDGPEILAYKIDSISCFGGSDGRLTIKQVDGGMPGYTYYLNGIEGDTSFEGLKNKTYHFRLLDKKGCKLDKYYTIPQPNDISISGTVINPVCHDSFDGCINTQISGGNGGYLYLWSNKLTSKDLQNLNSGNYTLTVTDKKACYKLKSFEITPPPAPSAHLDQNTGVLCTGNSLELDGGNFVNYQWYKDAVLVSENRYLTVDQTGQYTLKISNEHGCIGVDTFDLEVSDTPLDATLLLQDSALVDEVVRVIDVTWPIPDSIQWYFDYPVELVDNNNYSQKFSSNSTGTINVTLRAWYGGCFSDSSKSVTIYYEEGGVPQKSAINEPLILGYTAYPNPNEGDFYIGVELSRQADISLHLYNVGSGTAIDINRQYGLERYDVPFNLTGLKPGVYIIVLIVEHEQQRLKIVIN